MIPEFKKFPKIPRLTRDCCITEKIDGTNACIYVDEDSSGISAGSRKRWLALGSDNFGFAAWALDHGEELIDGLGPGLHFGEWYGKGIQRGYDLDEKRFSLFNTAKWGDAQARPACCGVVPVLYEGEFNTVAAEMVLEKLAEHGSFAAPGYMNPEGIVIFHKAGNLLFKKTNTNDERPKGA